MLRPVKHLGGFPLTVQPDFLKQAAFCLFQKWAAAGRLQTGFLHLTYATSKPLISWVKKTVAKLTLCATSGKKIGGSLEVYIVLSTVWLLRIAGSLANARSGF